MKVRLEGGSVAELDRMVEALRRVFDVGEVSRDYRNRHGAAGLRRYVEVSLLDEPSPAMLFGYRQGSGARPSPLQTSYARRLLAGELGDGLVPVEAYALAEEILGRGRPVPVCPPSGVIVARYATAAAPAGYVCRGAVCDVEPCVFRSAGECPQ